MFSLEFTTGPQTDAEGWLHAFAELQLGAYRERLACDVRYWQPADYERQWRRAVARLVNGQDRTRLLTSYLGPESGHHFSWPMWREGETVWVQEQLVMLEGWPVPFDPEAAWEWVPSRRMATEDGEAVSQWTVPLADLVAWQSR